MICANGLKLTLIAERSGSLICRVASLGAARGSARTAMTCRGSFHGIDLRGQPVVHILEEAGLARRRHFNPLKEDGPHMRTYTAVVEHCAGTGLFVGYVPGFAGAHSQGESLDELNRNLQEVIEMLLEEGEPRLDTQFVGTQTVTVG